MMRFVKIIFRSVCYIPISQRGVWITENFEENTKIIKNNLEETAKMKNANLEENCIP